MILLKNPKAIVRSSDGDPDFFDIVVSCYSPTYAYDKTDMTTFYLSLLDTFPNITYKSSVETWILK